MSPLLTAALTYAATGLAVLPLHTPVSASRCSCRRDCGSIGKHPRLQHGAWEASTNPEQIRRWWTMWPSANLGLRTGEVLDVCDVDSAEGLNGLLQLLGDAAMTGPVARTGSGGWHFYVAAGNRPNRVRLLPGVDWRGVGGYVVAPPSRHVSGRQYRWTRALTTSVPACPAPLAALLDRDPAPAAGTAVQDLRHADRYAQAAVEGEAARVAAAVPGCRNDTLNRAAYALGQLVGGNLLDEHAAVAALSDAAAAAGLGAVEAARTIRSGLTAGAHQPRRPRS